MCTWFVHHCWYSVSTFTTNVLALQSQSFRLSTSTGIPVPRLVVNDRPLARAIRREAKVRDAPDGANPAATEISI